MPSTNPGEEGKPKAGKAYFENGKQDFYLQKPYQSTDLKVPAMTLSVPLRTADGRLVAVLAARLDLVALTTIVGRRAGQDR
ncbi:MAG: PDC sensor domain-containing protein [Comamonadaceae bacterium]|nr:PDC sensor domain-containing protein [Comamonadaceae bacterium]